jgi:hypothetical protein
LIAQPAERAHAAGRIVRRGDGEAVGAALDHA